MKTPLILAITLALGLFTAARAEGPVVVELYTSQGCSSCPPADAVLGELAERDDIIALSLHVDYWDYIGWKDAFALPSHTRRQKGYARAVGDRVIYTPQMVIGGKDHVIGHKPLDVAQLLNAHAEKSTSVSASIQRTGDRTVRVTARTTEPFDAKALVQVVRYIPKATVDIKRGENAGRTMTYHNIVTAWEHNHRWDGAKPLNLEVELSGDGPVVVLIQQRRSGAMIASARVR